MMAFYALKPPNANNRQFRQHLLIDSTESLVQQARPDRTSDDMFKQLGNRDGAGLACYLPGRREAMHFRSVHPADTSPEFPRAIRESLKRSPSILLAHIRRASPDSPQVHRHNVHPFTHNRWSFMHNGDAHPALASDTFQREIARTANFLGAKPKGNTDSEIILRLFLTRLQANTVPSGDAIRTREVFAGLMADLCRANGDRSPGNFIVTDGERLYAFKGEKDLHLLRHGSEYILSSEPIRPWIGRKPPAWEALPNNSVIVLDRAAKTPVVIAPLPSR